MKITTTTTYRIVSSLLGTRPNAKSVESFTDFNEAVRHWEDNYRDRSKGDGYDEYWRKTPLMILEETEKLIIP